MVAILVSTSLFMSHSSASSFGFCPHELKSKDFLLHHLLFLHQSRSGASCSLGWRKSQSFLPLGWDVNLFGRMMPAVPWSDGETAPSWLIRLNQVFAPFVLLMTNCLPNKDILNKGSKWKIEGKLIERGKGQHPCHIVSWQYSWLGEVSFACLKHSNQSYIAFFKIIFYNSSLWCPIFRKSLS